MRKLMGMFFLLLFTSSVSAEGACGAFALNGYLDFRAALLSVNISKRKVLSHLTPDFESRIKPGLLEESIIEMRLQEAKIINIFEYSEKCDEKGGVLIFKILHYDPKIDRMKIWVEITNNKYLVKGFALGYSVEDRDYDKGVNYQPFSLSPPLKKTNKPPTTSAQEQTSRNKLATHHLSPVKSRLL